MYFLYASPNEAKTSFFESVLYTIDKSKTLLAVANGFDLITYLQQVRKGESYPELIILEMEMPKLGGAETLELLKSDDIYRLIPVIVLFAEGKDKDVVFCTRLGADCLQQPTSNAGWKATIQQLCHRCDN